MVLSGVKRAADACVPAFLRDAPPMFRSLACLVLLLSAALSAADRFVVDDEAFEENAIAAATALHKQGKLVSLTKLRKQLKRTHCEVTLPAPRKDRLRPPEVYRLVRNSTVVVATFYKCTACKK